MMKFWNRKNRKKGFTLVELIVVIAILVILAAILIPVVSGYIKDAEDTTAYANARTVYTAAMAYCAKNNCAPSAWTQADTVLNPYLGTNFGNWSVTLSGTNIASTTWTNPAKTSQTATYTPNA